MHAMRVCLLSVDVETNTTAISHQSKYNEFGYVFTAAVGRTYWVHWDIPYRVDPARSESLQTPQLGSSHVLYSLPMSVFFTAPPLLNSLSHYFKLHHITD